jgi:hypothetical protein
VRPSSGAYSPECVEVERRSMKTMLVGALVMFALQVVLVGSYLVVDSQDPIILDPESGSLEEDGLTMVMLCGEGHTPEGRGSEVLSKMPPDGDIGAWSRGRALQRGCDIWYHHNILYNPHALETCLIGCDHDWLERRLR